MEQGIDENQWFGEMWDDRINVYHKCMHSHVCMYVHVCFYSCRYVRMVYPVPLKNFDFFFLVRYVAKVIRLKPEG